MKKMILTLVCAITAVCSVSANPLFENWKLAAQHRTGCEMVTFLKAEIEKSDDIEVIREARRLIKEVYDPISKMEIRKSDDTFLCIVVGCYTALAVYLMYKACTHTPYYDARDLMILELGDQLAENAVFPII